MHRRHFLQTAAAAAIAPLPLRAAPETVRRIDTHTHFYDPARPGGVPWPEKGSSLYRKVMPADWRSLALPHGVAETIVIEASPWLEDNQWVQDLAIREKCILGFIGNLEPMDPGFPANLKRFATSPLFLGIRWRGELISQEKNKADVLACARQLAKKDLTLDLNGPPDTLPQAVKLAADVPDLRIVIDHGGSPGDPRTLSADWKSGITALAGHPNVFMKVSGLLEQVKCEPGQAPGDPAFHRPVLDHLWAAFGPDRLIYGSNWPVSDQGAPYATVFKMVEDYFASKGSAAVEKYFGKNSQAAYRWKERQ